jgi:hypothetical protein
MAEARLRDQVDRLQSDPVRPPEKLGIGDRPSSVKGEGVVGHG